ncbi:unnamed protein product, partial [Effrenium voratum]
MVGTWLQGIASVKSVGAAAYANEGAGAGGGGGGEVFVLETSETTGPLRQADLPGRDFFGKNTLDCAWAGKWLPGVEEHCALRLVERIRNFNLAKVAERLDLSLPKASWTLGSVSVTSTSLAAQEERCFLALRGKELRLAVSVALGSQRLLLLSENLLQEEESGSWHARLRASSKGAHELAEELQEDLQVALRRSEWRPALNAWRDAKGIDRSIRGFGMRLLVVPSPERLQEFADLRSENARLQAQLAKAKNAMAQMKKQLDDATAARDRERLRAESLQNVARELQRRLEEECAKANVLQKTISNAISQNAANGFQ